MLDNVCSATRQAAARVAVRDAMSRRRSARRPRRRRSRRSATSPRARGARHPDRARPSAPTAPSARGGVARGASRRARRRPSRCRRRARARAVARRVVGHEEQHAAAAARELTAAWYVSCARAAGADAVARTHTRSTRDAERPASAHGASGRSSARRSHAAAAAPTRRRARRPPGAPSRPRARSSRACRARRRVAAVRVERRAPASPPRQRSTRPPRARARADLPDEAAERAELRAARQGADAPRTTCGHRMALSRAERARGACGAREARARARVHDRQRRLAGAERGERAVEEASSSPGHSPVGHSAIGSSLRCLTGATPIAARRAAMFLGIRSHTRGAAARIATEDTRATSAAAIAARSSRPYSGGHSAFDAAVMPPAWSRHGSRPGSAVVVDGVRLDPDRRRISSSETVGS